MVTHTIFHEELFLKHRLPRDSCHVHCEVAEYEEDADHPCCVQGNHAAEIDILGVVIWMQRQEKHQRKNGYIDEQVQARWEALLEKIRHCTQCANL